MQQRCAVYVLYVFVLALVKEHIFYLFIYLFIFS